MQPHIRHSRKFEIKRTVLPPGTGPEGYCHQNRAPALDHLLVNRFTRPSKTALDLQMIAAIALHFEHKARKHGVHAPLQFEKCVEVGVKRHDAARWYI